MSSDPTLVKERVEGSAQSFPFDLAVQVPVLVLLFTVHAIYEALHLSALTGEDVWLHLRTGIWILQNHAIPRTGLFSQFPDLPWVAHSWGFDVLLAAAYQVAGLRALPLLLMGFHVALSIGLFLLARGSRQNFWPGVVLAGIAQYAIPGVQLQPGLCSILLLAVEVGLLLHVRRTGESRLLLWLPLLFAAWANLHIQFVYGLFVVLMFLMALVAEQVGAMANLSWFTDERKPVSLTFAGAAMAASFLATLLTPYGYRIYEVMPRVFSGPISFRFLPEHSAVGFRRPQDFVLLSLAMTAFFCLGRRRSRDLFKILLLLSAAMVSFSTQSDSWVVAVVSVAIIGDAVPGKALEPVHARVRLWRPQYLLTGAFVLLVLAMVARRKIPSSREALLADVGTKLPVAACDYIRNNHLDGPLFNAYEWGGFVTWYLPDYPVVMDARHDLYGEDMEARYFRETRGQIPINEDFQFLMAGTLLLPTDVPMAVALSKGPRFTVVYQDSIAMVLQDVRFRKPK